MPTPGPTAAYLYVLSLDSSGRAWEYLRRNVDYARDWATQSDPSAESFDQGSAAQTWGLRFPGGSEFRRPRGGAALAA
jgi:hypothetical protein